MSPSWQTIVLASMCYTHIKELAWKQMLHVCANRVCPLFVFGLHPAADFVLPVTANTIDIGSMVWIACAMLYMKHVYSIRYPLPKMSGRIHTKVESVSTDNANVFSENCVNACITITMHNHNQRSFVYSCMSLLDVDSLRTKMPFDGGQMSCACM